MVISFEIGLSTYPGSNVNTCLRLSEITMHNFEFFFLKLSKQGLCHVLVGNLLLTLSESVWYYRIAINAFYHLYIQINNMF